MASRPSLTKSAKTPRNFVADFLDGVKTKNSSPSVRHVALTKEGNSPQDIANSFSVLSDKDEGQTPTKSSSKSKRYPGSGSKRASRGNLRTPMQTVPLAARDKQSGKLASRSFVLAHGCDTEVETPRTNLSAFLSTADTEERALRSTRKISGSPAVFKAPRVSELISASWSKRVSSPGSKMTPRSNIWGLLNDAEDGDTVSPAVGSAFQPSKSTKRRSTSQSLNISSLRKVGQEVAVSPMSFSSRVSSDQSGRSVQRTPGNSAKVRRSFHIPGTDKIGVLQNQDVQERSRLFVTTDQDTESSRKHLGDEALAIREDNRQNKGEQIPANIEGGTINTYVQESLSPRDATEDMHEESMNKFSRDSSRDRTEFFGHAMSFTANLSERKDGSAVTTFRSGGNNRERAVNESRNVDGLMAQEDGLGIINEKSVLDNVEQSSESRSNVNDGTGNGEAITSRNTSQNSPSHFGLISENQIGGARDSSDRIDRRSEDNENGQTAGLSKQDNTMTAASKTSVYDLSVSSIGSNAAVSSPQRSPRPSLGSSVTTPSNSIQKRKLESRETAGSDRKQRSGSDFGNLSSSFTPGSKKRKPSYSEWKSLQQKQAVSNTEDYLSAASPVFSNRSTRSSATIHSSTPMNRSKRVFMSPKVQRSVRDFFNNAEDLDVDPFADLSPIGPKQGHAGTAPVGSFQQDEEEAGTDFRWRKDGDVEEKTQERGEGISHNSKPRIESDESEDELPPGITPLRTPHLNINKPNVVSTLQRPVTKNQEMNSVASKLKQTTERVITGSSGRKRNQSSSKALATTLPRKATKFFAERASDMPLSKCAIEEIERVSERFWADTLKALEAYCLHAGRKTINEEDCILLMKTQGLISGIGDLHDKIRELVPMEDRCELIPCIGRKNQGK